MCVFSVCVCGGGGRVLKCSIFDHFVCVCVCVCACVCVCQVSEGVLQYQAVLVEMVVTFQLVLCVLATARPKSAFHLLGPLLVGLSVTLGHLVAVRIVICL